MFVVYKNLSILVFSFFQRKAHIRTQYFLKTNFVSTVNTQDLSLRYIIVKDSSADLGVNFKIVQNRPTVKAVCTKISKTFLCIFVNILVFLRENKEASFFHF